MKKKYRIGFITLVLLLLLFFLAGCSIEFDGKTSIERIFARDTALTLIIKQDASIEPDCYEIVIKNASGSEVAKREINRESSEDIKLIFELEKGTYDISIEGKLCTSIVSRGERLQYVYDGKNRTVDIALKKTDGADSVSHGEFGYTEIDPYKHKKTCSLCHKSWEEDHTFGEWESDADGHYKRSCTLNCGYVDKTSEWDHFKKVESLCWKAGNEEYWKCKFHDNEYLIKDGNGVIDTETWKTKVEIRATGNHTWSAEYSKDNENHWKKCTTEGCTAKNEEAKHEYERKESYEGSAISIKDVCTVCQYERPLSTGGFNAIRILGDDSNLVAYSWKNNSWNFSVSLGDTECCKWFYDGKQFAENSDSIAISVGALDNTKELQLRCYIYKDKDAKEIKEFVLITIPTV